MFKIPTYFVAANVNQSEIIPYLTLETRYNIHIMDFVSNSSKAKFLDITAFNFIILLLLELMLKIM